MTRISTTGLKIIHEDDKLLVVDKPAGIAVLREGPLKPEEETVAELLYGQYPELQRLGEKYRYGIVHRLDKDTSGLLLVAKTKEAFEFLQKQFQARNVEKKYICLVAGPIKEDKGVIHTLLERSPGDRRKQKASPLDEGNSGEREALSEYQVLQRYEGYILLEVAPKTGRKHQIRAHMAYLQHPIVGDRLYGFKNQPAPQGLTRQFLHASYLKIPTPDGGTKDFTSELPKDLAQVLEKLIPLL